MKTSPKDILDQLFDAALQAADPVCVVPQCLPKPPENGRVFVIGAGKASAVMAKALEDNWDHANYPISGFVVTRYDYAVECAHIKIVEAAHPVPDEAGHQAAKDMLEFISAQNLTEDDLVICLISGGGSALLSLPAPCLSFEEKQSLSDALLKSGASIHDMNTVRKHVSSVKGGRLAEHCAPAKLHSILISDVPGDDVNVIASGPTVPDPSTREQALEIIERYQLPVPQAALDYLNTPESETPKTLPEGEVIVAVSAQNALEAAAEKARELGITPYILSDAMEGEARECAKFHADLTKQMKYYGQPFETPCVLLSGGETTVTIRGNGRGGRNTEFLLSLGIALQGIDGISAMACDTDGIDGMCDNAGAYILSGTVDDLIEAKTRLDNNDAYSYFEDKGTLVITGPTKTNVNDFRALLVLE